MLASERLRVRLVIMKWITDLLVLGSVFVSAGRDPEMEMGSVEISELQEVCISLMASLAEAVVV